MLRCCGHHQEHHHRVSFHLQAGHERLVWCGPPVLPPEGVPQDRKNPLECCPVYFVDYLRIAGLRVYYLSDHFYRIVISNVS